MSAPKVDPIMTKQLLDTRFVKVYELAYEDGTRYFDASRRGTGDLLALKDVDELASALPDAVSCCLVLLTDACEPRIVLSYEYRYPTGQYMLSIPSGLIDASDREREDPLVTAMTREIGEECGLELGEGDRIWVTSPLLFNSPGFTDESTAMLCAVVRRADDSGLSQSGAEGSERFEGFELLTKEEVCEILRVGKDPHGHYYPMVTWVAMMLFVTDQWRDEP